MNWDEGWLRKTQLIFILGLTFSFQVLGSFADVPYRNGGKRGWSFCSWALSMEQWNREGRRRNPYLPSISRNWTFLQRAQFGFANYSAGEPEEGILLYDENFRSEIVLANVIHSRRPRTTFRVDETSATRKASRLALSWVVDQMMIHPDPFFRELYKKEGKFLHVDPLGQKFNVENPKAHPLLVLGKILPHDFLLLRFDEEGGDELVGGFVAYPSNWSLQSNMGLSMLQIHAYMKYEFLDDAHNDRSAKIIDGLPRLFREPELGVMGHRNNWFVKNHPILADFNTSINLRSWIKTAERVEDNLFLRMERETFYSFESGGHRYLLMIIRPYIYDIKDVGKFPEVTRRMIRGLENPFTANRCKRLRPELLEYLKARLP